jgi:Uma2 family endonuclease
LRGERGYITAMRHDPFYEPITAEQFLAIDFGSDRKFELVDGVIQMMTGGTPAHSRVATNILSYLGPRLRGTGCRAYNSDMGIRLADDMGRNRTSASSAAIRRRANARSGAFTAILS